MCSGIEGTGPGPRCCFWIPDDNSPAVNGGTAASSSGGAVGAQEAEQRPSPGGAAGASRPPFISYIEVGGLASAREGEIDV